MRLLIATRTLLVGISLAVLLVGCTARNPAKKVETGDEKPAHQTGSGAAPAETDLPATPDRYAGEDIRFINRELAKNCPGCAFANIDLRGADLAHANLPGADLSGADLSKANLRRANLRGARLEGANFSGADLGGADLQGANLRGAILTGANLYQTDLKNADLDGIMGTTFEGALR
jgi:uncharacterized protein YjbI with pentapeptide repeats